MMKKQIILSIVLVSLMLIPTAYALPVKPKSERSARACETFIYQSPTINYAVSGYSNGESPEPTPSGRTALPYSIIGEDYLRYYANHDPSVWTSGIMNKFTYWKCNAARLAFAFADAPTMSNGRHCCSDYVEWKMDAVIDIFDSYGINVILDNHNYGDHKDYLGSTAWINNWKAIAQHYKGDKRIAGFNIFNEPTKLTWAHSGPLGDINTKEKFMQVCKYLIDEIRTIDPSRTIFFPTCAGMGIGYDDPTTTYNAMVTYGIIAQGNIIMDISHPYYWENEWDLYATPSISPEQAVNNLMVTQIDPAIALFGADHLWIGETFAWQYGNTGRTYEYQVRWITALVNACLERGVGIQIYAYSAQQQWNDAALQASKY